VGYLALCRKRPNLAKTLIFQGQADIRWEQGAETAKEFHSELALVPSDADAKYNVGFVYLQQSKMGDEVALFQQVVAERPDHATPSIRWER
jgi:hypothetical protein